MGITSFIDYCIMEGMKLTDEQVAYINKKEPPRRDGMIITKDFAESVLGEEITIEFLKKSPWFIDKPILVNTN